MAEKKEAEKVVKLTSPSGVNVSVRESKAVSLKGMGYTAPKSSSK